MAGTKRREQVEPVTLDELRPQSKSVLAVLSLARVWETRFPDGWVSVNAFAECGRFLGERNDRESLTRSIRRAIEQIECLAPPIQLGRRRTPAGSKEEDRRLLEPFPFGIELWLLREGGEYLFPEIWREFLATQYRPVTSFEEVVAGLEESVARALLDQGRHDEAIERARTALAETSAERDRRPLQLALATALIRRARPDDWKEAERLLEGLYASPLPVVDHYDRVTAARVRMRLAHCLYFLHLRGTEPTGDERDHAEQLAVRIRRLLAEAAAATTALSLSDRGNITTIEGFMLLWEAQNALDEEQREELYDLAERYLRQALTIWRTAQDSYGLGAALYNLGQLRFSRYRLHRGTGTEEQIRDALVWFEASAYYTELLGTLREWVLDYIHAAECLGLLIPHLRAKGRDREITETVARAEAHLARAKEAIASGSWQQKMLVRVRTMLTRVQGHSGPDRSTGNRQV